MLNIRPEQMAVFEKDGARRFEDEMLAHSKEFSPRLCELIGDDQLRVALKQSIGRAKEYGFSNRGPIRLYIELMFLAGSDFDTDPQYPGLGEVLRGRGAEMVRAERIFERINDYRENVSGEYGVNARKALAYLADFGRQPDPFTEDGLVSQLLAGMRASFPLKADYLGEPALLQLIAEGRAAAQRYGLKGARAEAMIVILMFAFGHGCVADPLYPWISQVLTDERITSAEARGQRLERKALTWLDHVLARPLPGGEA
jgi:hypothetical protein